MLFWFLSPISIQRPVNDRKIEWSNEPCFGQQEVLVNSIENLISQEIVFVVSAACHCPVPKICIPLYTSHFWTKSV